MFARLLAAFCCASALAFSGSLVSGSQTVVVFLDEKPPSPTLEAMQRETADQMARAGFQTVWKTSGTFEHGSVVVAKLLGACSAAAIPKQPARTAGQELAGTRVIEDRISPFISLDCNRVNEFLGAIPGPLNDQAYGRALGRLFAHELYHFLAQTKDHSKSGIAQAAITPSELLAEDFRFDAQAVGRLRPPAEHGI